MLSLLPETLRYALTVDDEEVRTIAEACADRCRRMALHHNVKRRVNPLTNESVNALDKSASTRLEQLTDICQSIEDEIYLHFTDYCATFRIQKIKVNEKDVTNSHVINTDVTILGAIKRMINKNWWMRRLRKLFNQSYEQAAIELNLVNKYKQIYASDLTVKKRK